MDDIAPHLPQMMPYLLERLGDTKVKPDEEKKEQEKKKVDFYIATDPIYHMLGIGTIFYMVC